MIQVMLGRKLFKYNLFVRISGVPQASNTRAYTEVTHHSGHGSAQAREVYAIGVPCGCPSCQSQLPAMTIDSLQPDHGLPPYGSLPVRSKLFSHSKYIP